MPRRTEPEPFHAAIGQRIKAFLDANGIIQERAAERCGIAKGHFSNILRGLVRAGLDLYTKISRGIGLPLDEMVGDTPIEPIPPRSPRNRRTRRTTEEEQGK